MLTRVFRTLLVMSTQAPQAPRDDDDDNDSDEEWKGEMLQHLANRIAAEAKIERHVPDGWKPLSTNWREVPYMDESRLGIEAAPITETELEEYYIWCNTFGKARPKNTKIQFNPGKGVHGPEPYLFRFLKSFIKRIHGWAR